MRRGALIVIGLLITVQAALIGLWLAVEWARDPGEAESTELVVTASRTLPLNRPAPELTMERPDGTIVRLSERRGRPLLLHFWATWCPPCREELESLLAFAAETPALELLAVSVNPGWPPIWRHFGRSPMPPTIYRASSAEVDQAFGVRSLPSTFVVNAEGVLRLRLDGARDWSSPEARALVSDTE